MDLTTVKNFVKAVRVEQDLRNDAKFVKQISGKSLSTNDFTSAEKEKLSAIASGAQVNLIENISVDGILADLNSDTKVANISLADYAKKSDVASVFKYKGTVQNFADLPADAKTGDVYNISLSGGADQDGNSINAGDNVAKTDGGWDVLAGAIDTSNFVSKIQGKDLSTNDFTTEEKNKLAAISANAQVNVIENISVNGQLAEIDSATKVANITFSGGTASLGSVLNAINQLDSIEEGNILYSSANNTFQPTVITSFARNLLTCNSAEELRNYWAGVRDVDFDDCGNSWSAVGSPFLSFKNARFNKALQLNGSSYLKMNAPITLGGSPFSIDCCFFYIPDSSFSYQSIWSLFNSADNRLRFCTFSNSKKVQSVFRHNASTFAESASSSPVDLAHHHLELDFDGSTFFFFLDGILQDSYQFALPLTSYDLFLGNSSSTATNAFFTGSISEFRISSICRHTQNFTPPQLPAQLDSDTIVLLRFNG